jgi:hypothetical protein
MQLPSILVLAAATDCGAFDEMLRLFGIAAIVYAVFKGIRSLMPQAAAPPQPHPAPATHGSHAQPAPASAAGITPEILAVIAAAVATTTSSSHRIVTIRSESSQWEKAGRQSVLTSHRIR